MAKSNRFDVIVVGAGAAGLLAAGRAADKGASTVLIEKKDIAGKKLLITGKGRCNITNTAKLNEFIKHFGKNGKFLRSAFDCFFNDDIISLLNGLGVETVEERGNRIFPKSNKAASVVDALFDWAISKGVTFYNDSEAINIITDEEKTLGVSLKDGQTVCGDNVIVTTGGKSYPGTGSNGSGYKLAGKVGHKIIEPMPALVPLKTFGELAPKLQGVSLKNVKASLWINGKKKREEFGEMLFTHYGLSGPIILTLSYDVVVAMRLQKEVKICIDLKPALDEKKLDGRLQRDIDNHGKRRFKTILEALLPKKMINVCLEKLDFDSDKPANQISSKERKRLRNWLKNVEFIITGDRGYNEAIVTAGGISLKEINHRTMESNIINGLFFAGEVLDIDADTGGYNLQAAFSTGWLAGQSATKK